MSVCKPPFMMRDDSLTVLVDNASYTVNKSDARYAKLITLSKQIGSAKGDVSKYPTLEQWKDAVKIEAPKPIAEVVKAAPSVSAQDVAGNEDLIVVDEKTGLVTVNGTLTHNTITARIAQFVGAGLPFDPLVNFFRKLLRNPSFTAQQQLLNFMDNRSLPITAEGNVLAYKAVTDDWKDKWTGKIDNSIGATPSMPRSQVEDNPNRPCGPGLHMGGLDYVKDYGRLGYDRIIIVELDPANAVSVPTDCGCKKLRSCGYKVVAEYKGEMSASPLYSTDARPYGWQEDEVDDEESDFGDWEDDSWEDDDIINAVEDEDDDNWDDEDEDEDWDDEDDDQEDTYWPFGYPTSGCSG